MFRHLFILTVISLTKEVYTDTNYRLNTPITPISYAISITPYFETGDDRAFTFDGEVTINLSAQSDTSQIKLHSEDLIFNASNITVSTATTGAGISLSTATPLEFDLNYSFAHINLANPLVSGVEYTVKIVYRGPIRQDLNGFYRNYYIENGVKKWLGATQMEPTHARKVFPCFDEPGLKATFTLTIDTPESYQPSLSNTKRQTAVPLGNGYIRETFYPTPKMSTYLVAFVVSEFLPAQTMENGTKEFGVYTRPDATNQSSYTFDFGERVVDALGEYFGIDYYSSDVNLKLNHIALPDFRAGAMENWGLVTYREASLLYVPEESAPYYKYRVSQIIAHETTHMWFGNLVTCHWWSNTWLNEGFANYFQDYITSLIQPDVGAAEILVTGSVYSAYDADDSTSSPAITNEDVNSPAEISGHFGTVTYQKAGSVIRMMHHLLGNEAFRYGLNTYLNNIKFNSGYPDLLYSALEQGVAYSNALTAYPGSTVNDVMSSWISQAGHPILDVNVDYEDDTITLTQRRFYINANDKSNEIYKIPVTYTTERSPNFDNTKPAFIMANESHVFSIANISQDHSWIIFNIQETGLYRVNYDEHSWQIISSALKGENRNQIHHLNRAKIVNDLFAFLYADEVDFKLLQDVLEFLSDETDYSVWFAAIRGFNKLRTYYLGSDALSTIENYELQHIDNIASKLGFETGAPESVVTQRQRMEVLEFACKIGHQGCIDTAVELFRSLRENGTEIAPSLRSIAYCYGLRHGDGEDYEFLWRRMSTTNVANEARLIGDILGCTNDEEKLKKFLVSMLEENSPIKTQDLTVPLTSVLSNYKNVHLVMDQLKENYTLWTSIYTTMDTVLATVASALHTEEEFDEFETWLSSCTQCTEAALTSARKSLASAKASAIWAEEHKDEILSSLRSKALLHTPSLAMLTLAMLTVYFKF